VTKFAEHLRLRDPRRESLKLSPEHDAEIFVDIDQVLPDVARALEATPKLVIFGDYGTGKSQLLRHIQKVVAKKRDYRGLYVTLSGFERKSRFARVHALVMEQLEKPLLELFELPGNDGWIERAEVSVDVKHALRQLRNPKVLPNDKARIRGWLKGPGVTGPQASKLGFSGRLLDQAGPAQLVDLWKTIGRLYRENAPDQAKLLLLFDEGESIQQILGPEGQHEIGNGFRHLLDQDNDSVGCVFGLNLPVARGAHPFFRADVKRRYDDMAINLKPIASGERAKPFVDALWPMLTAPDAPPLLAAPAMKYVGDHLIEIRERLDTAVAEEINRAATQADLLVVLDYLAHSAVDSHVALPLSLVDVRKWLRMTGA
jgi:energy-coupling factor transporter ATP-binding protein EcfA2